MNKEVELVNEMIRLGYVSLDPTNKNNILLEIKYDDNDIRTESVPILNAVLEITHHPEQYQEIKDTIFDVRKDKISLTEFLEFFDFDYSIVSDEDDLNTKYIKLIDLTGANLGDIENDFLLVSNGMYALFERLDVYLDDYIFEPLKEKLEELYQLDTSNMSWKDMYEYALEQKISFDGDDLCPYIFQEKQLNLTDFLNKMILNDITFEYHIGEKTLEELMQSVQRNINFLIIITTGLADIGYIERTLESYDKDKTIDKTDFEEVKMYLENHIDFMGSQDDYSCYLDEYKEPQDETDTFYYNVVAPHGSEIIISGNKSNNEKTTIKNASYYFYDTYNLFDGALNCIECTKLKAEESLYKYYQLLVDDWQKIEAINEEVLETIDYIEEPYLYACYLSIEALKEENAKDISLTDMIYFVISGLFENELDEQNIKETQPSELLEAYKEDDYSMFNKGMCL